jgi:2-C-methyl-D-erythritol 2,4-cyclodiphosphate synthase
MDRIGFGYDIHRLEQGFDLWLGGVLVPAEKGAVGHSDADVLIHAICDSLLGAASLGDIGFHFPDTSSEFKGISSSILLKKVIAMVLEKAYGIGNIDATIVLEKPKLSSFIPDIIKSLAEISGIPAENISVKATTKENMDATGKGEAIEAYSVALIFPLD